MAGRTPSFRRRLKFTREGFAFCGITLAIGMAAINTGNNLLFLVLGALLSLILLSGVVSDLTLRRLSATRVLPQRIHAQRPVQLGFMIANGKGRLSTLSIEVEELGGGGAFRPCYFLRVPAKNQRTVTYETTFARRGECKLSGFRISTAFPFGLFRKSIEVVQEESLLVLPAIRQVVLPHAPSYPMPGDLAATRATRRGEFHGLRDHRPGDDVRDIHWRKTAQRGRPVVKEYHDDTLRKVVLVLDNRIPRSASKDDHHHYEHAISTVASLAHRYIHAGYEVALHIEPLSASATNAAFPRSAVLTGRGPAHLHALLRTLAVVEPHVTDETEIIVPPGLGTRDRRARLYVSRATSSWR